VRGPNTTNSSTTPFILTTEPQGPYVLLPQGSNVTSNPSAPNAVLQLNCSFISYSSPGVMAFATPLPTPAPTGPCQLALSPNGTLYISDLGNGGAVVWSNELLTNRTNNTCSPYSLSVLTNGVMIERDCRNRTVWSAPQLGGALPSCAIPHTSAFL
jgi:hypothetical protein